MPRICSPLRQTGDHVLVILDVLGGVRDIHQSLCACKVARAPMSLWIQYLQRGSQRAPSSRGSIPCRVVPFHGVAGPLGRIRSSSVRRGGAADLRFTQLANMSDVVME